MKPTEEQRLRAQISDLVLEWYSDGDGADLDQATVGDFKDLIRAAQIVSDEAGHSLSRWVDAGRHAGLSWAEIGDVLGVSRQAAQQRFSPSDIGPTAGGDWIVRTRMTAFNELAALAEEGLKGNELVDAAPLKLFFAPRGRPWRNIRVTAFGTRRNPTVKRFEDDGWKKAVEWGPFYYFTRPADSEAPVDGGAV
jgi:hypothetical protein